MEADVSAEADAIFQSIIFESMNVSGDHGLNHGDLVAANSEADLTKLREGRAFYKRHLASCGVAIISTLILEYPIQRLMAAFCRQPNFGNPIFGMQRAILTYVNLHAWLCGSIEDKLSEAAQSLYKTRKFHADFAKKVSSIPRPPTKIPRVDRIHVLHAIRRDLAHIPDPDFLPTIMTDTPTVWMSQFDIMMSHGIFYFVLDLNPKVFGIFSDEGYESYIYYCGIIARHMGVEDRFNLALYPNPVVRKRVVERIWDEVVIPCLKNWTEVDFKNACSDHEELGLLKMLMGGRGIESDLYYGIRDFSNASAGTNVYACVSLIDKVLAANFRLALSMLQFRLCNSVANMFAKVGLRVMRARERRRLLNNAKNIKNATSIA